ncbi:MAG: YceI family protein [Pseudomonadota bacterium]|nr:YceI family protein [Pseudomonadota bacterium]
MHHLALAVLLAAAAPADARARTVPITPQIGEVHIGAAALRLFSVGGRFTRFEGTLTYDPAELGRCSVALTVDVASLVSSSAVARREMILGPEFLDAARYPYLRFEGRCQGTEVEGSLSMHGVTRPLRLEAEWQERRVVVSGRLLRALWGIGGRPLVVGPMIRIRVVAGLS